MKTYYLYDCRKEDNDKVWLSSVSEDKNYEDIYVKKSIAQFTIKENSAKLGKLKAYYIRLQQCLKVMWKANENDVVVCWENMTGLLLNYLTIICHKHLRLIIMTWLTPRADERKWVKKLQYKAASNAECFNIANDEESIEKWKGYLNINNGNFVYVPDVLDVNITYKEPDCESQEDYCFVGGMNNRDWNLVAELAKLTPHIKYICVALMEDFQSKVHNVPDNLNVFYNTSYEQYSRYMSKAKVVLLPLIDNKVSGLINILSAAREGVLCCITDFSFSKKYYPSDSNLLLNNDVLSWKKQVENIFNLPGDMYNAKVKECQNHIKKYFSADVAIVELRKVKDQLIKGNG